MGKKFVKRVPRAVREPEPGFDNDPGARKQKAYQKASRQAEQEFDGEMDNVDQEQPERESHWIDFAAKEQKDIVHEELNQFGNGDEPWQVLVVKGDNNIFLYSKGSNTSIYLMPREAKDRFKPLMGNPGLRYFGLYLGNFKGDQFNLSLEGATELAKSGAARKNWVKLNDEGEKSFLYGQDIKKADLHSVCERGITHNRGICLVLNALGECIGIGKLEARDPTFKKVSDEEILVKNVVDRGVYLRNQNRL
nr:hypothetical protein [Candidatus Sigynarchaeota archaeon]